MYNDILEKIKKCKEALLKVGEDAQSYIDEHNKYIEKNIKDASILKSKIKEKIARVINEN